MSFSFSNSALVSNFGIQGYDIAISRILKNFKLFFILKCILCHKIEPFDHLKTLSYFKDIASMTSQLSALDGTDNFNYLMALQDICSRIDSDSDSRHNSLAANSNLFSPFFFPFLWSGNFKSIFFKRNTKGFS